MTDVSSGRRKKRKLAPKAPKGPSESPKVIMLNSSVLLLEVPADTNTSLPVWDAVRSLNVGVTWTVKPYGISINVTPLTVKQEDITASCERENTSSVVESSSLQLQIQNSSCVLLTFSHNSLPTLPHTYQPNQSLVNPISVSLPLIITHSPQGYQPGTIATIKLPPAVQAPTSVSGDLDVEPKKPNLSSFHTKVSHDILICDNFLLGTCDAGVKCKLHHTPYPFHWQLWSIKTHQWIDLSPRAQLLLERSYCCAEQSDVTLIDKQSYYILDFDTMELDGFSEYDAVRRLTNSESVEKNPHFPSKSKIYWCEGVNYKEYSADLSAFLLKKMSEKELKCSFNIGEQKYEVDFTSMTQTRISTGFQRQICCRPAYRSPESMYPHLKSGIQSDFANCEPYAAAANFSIDPLQEFSSWYPPVWLQGSEEDYRLVDVPAGTQAYRIVKKFFHENLPETTMDIISIQQIQNLLHWDKYQRQKTHMQKHHTKAEGPLERHLFHGTTKVASESICLHGFDPRVAGLNGHSHGFGSYFATDTLMSHEYTEASESDEVGYMFLAKVLVGRVCLGKHYYRRPPNTKVSLYDACVDNKQNPQMFIVFDSCQCYPYYLIKYKKLSEEIDIHD
ncbi:protein mono-ADP-ribosyltransferase TIPARP-like [Gambusia affinis]|uniref:protein mono-ADP-ribosyltransferase TIPARP-like n=1 Tax=Gambusia affinis TaxID=33528 RepID=UPI001CDD05DE|nr:protein mono-ADP-ribosyltransferase TIPARP-like [Gambusia affinis]